MKKLITFASGWTLCAAMLVSVLTAVSLRAAEVTLIPLGTNNRVTNPQGSTNWHYRLGTSEASTPIAAWRTNNFVEDGTWSTGALPLGYATAANDPNGYEATLLTTVPAATTCVFVRKTFVVANRLAYSSVTVSGFADDGAVVWINGRELTPRFQCCTGGTDANAPTFDALSPAALESLPFSLTVPNDASGPLVDGTNILAIQLFNANNTSSDLVLDATLTGTLPQVNLLAPGYSIVGVAATVGSSVSAVAVSGTAGGVNNYPDAESPPNAIDANTGSKYLNFAKINCGFIVTIPNSIATVSEFKFSTANDAPERDPLTVTLEGTTAQNASTAAAGATWVTLYSGPSGLAADPGRLAAGASVTFANASAFNTYRMLITDVRNPGTANSLQFSEIQFLGQFVADTNPPTLVSFSPPAGTIQAPVSAVTVNFSEPVTGVDASDLLVNGAPATGVSGSGSSFVFTFPPLPFGVRHVAFSGSHGITDFGFPANPFNAAAAAWDYTVVDTIAPVVVTYLPATNTSMRTLSRVEVIFSEEVTGVDASDLLINGVPATGLDLGVPGQFAFTFPEPATGVVQVAWAPGHGIRDFAPVPNNFAGGAWTYLVNPNLTFDVRINEFMADNENGIRDEDGTRQDWLELFNAGSTVVDLRGWSLTDEIGNLGKWHFPAGALMQPNSYLLVWCSSKDRTNNIAALHTNFKLAKNGGFLALVLPDGTNIVSSFVPYPAQRTDISYGRDRQEPNIVGFYNTPTPNAPNSLGGPGSFTSEVTYSRSSSTFVSPFNLTLSTASTNAVIRYVIITTAAQASALVTNIPTTNSPIYTGAIPISVTTEVRARAFQPGLFPSAPVTESYIQIDSAVRDFSSDIPVCVVHMLGNGSIPTTTTAGILMAFDDDTGRSSLTNTPQMAARMGVHIRGSSTLNNAKSNLRFETWDEFNQDADHPLLGMPSDSDWVLYGINGFDPGLMHNAIYQWLGRTLGIFSMRTRYVEVFRKIDNGAITMNDYFGLYILMETPKVGNDRVNIASIHNEDTNTPAITGGYIMKIDRLDNEASLTPPTIGSIRPTPAPIVFTDPPYLASEADPRRLKQINYAKNYLLNFITNLSSASYTDPVAGYAQYINPDQWVNHLIANIVPFNVDGYRLSGFFYKDRNGRLEQGPMWDCDRCLGTGGTTTPQADNRCFSPRFWRLPANDVGTDNGTDFFGISNVGVSWFTPLFRDPNFWQRFIDRYQRVRTSEYSSNSIVAMIDGYYNEIKESQVREQARWAPSAFTFPRSGLQTVNGYTFDFGPADNLGRGRFTNEVNFQKRWLLDRLEFMDTNFLAMPTLSQGTTPVTTGTTVTVIPAAKAGSLLLYTLDGTDPRLSGGSVSPGARTNTGSLSLTISNNVRVFARSYNTSHANMTNTGTEVGKPLINSYWSGPAAATYFTVVPSLRITEIMYHPENPPIGNTNDADSFEYVEVKNIGATPLNVEHATLGGGIQFEFPNLVLAAGQACVVVKNLAAFQSRYGVSNPNILIAGVYTGTLANEGDHLVLLGGLQEPILDFNYSDGWYPITDGAGFSLVIVNENAALNTWGLKESWRPSGVENGSAGTNDPAPPVIAGLLVNEALTHTDLPQLDSIEIYNPTASDVNIGGWYLTDNFGNPKKFHVPPGTMILAGGYRVFTEVDFNTGPTAFSFSANGEEVYLFAGDTNGNLTGYFHGFDFGAAQNGRTFGRYVTSQGNEDFTAQSVNTLGAANALPFVGPVVISEIMYHPPETALGTNLVDNSLDEFIELYNLTTNAVPLYNTNANTWRFTQAIDFDFPANVSIAATSRVLVVNFNPNTNAAQVALFRAAYGVSPSIPLFGPYGGKLDNSGANLRLSRPDNLNLDGSVPYILVDRVQYADVGAWPAAADGAGASLQRIVAGGYGNDPTNWIAASANAGTPFIGGTPPVITQQPSNATVFVAGLNSLSPLYLTGTTNFRASVSGIGVKFLWRFNGIAIPGATNATLTLTNIQYSQAGQYSFTAFNGGGSVTSSNATLTVLTPVTFTIQPASQNVLVGTNVTLTAAAVGSGPITYQWRFEGTNIPNATNASYSFVNANLFAHHGLFTVAASDTISTTVSSNARIYVLVRPFVTQHIVGQTVPQGGTATFSLVVTGATPMVFRWIRNNGNLDPIFTSEPILVLPNVQAGYPLRVVVTNLATGQAQSPPSGNVTLAVTAIVDSDSDGIPDAWEIAYFGSVNTTNNAANALEDPDGDGMSNRDEYIAGTDPTNPLSLLKVVLTTTNANVIQFEAQTNVTYTVQAATNLVGAIWNRVTNVGPAATVRTIQVDTGPVPGVSQRYIRVVTPQFP